MFFTVSGAGGS